MVNTRVRDSEGVRKVRKKEREKKGEEGSKKGQRKDVWEV